MDADKIGFAFSLHDKVNFGSPACLITDILYGNIHLAGP
jgi:hypothetical protein